MRIGTLVGAEHAEHFVGFAGASMFAIHAEDGEMDLVDWQSSEGASVIGYGFADHGEKFVLLGGLWLAFMEGEPPAERTYRHVAFAVADGDLPACEARLRALGAEVRPPRPRVEGEGQSLYFYDFDNHLFELHTGTLAQRLARYAQG